MTLSIGIDLGTTNCSIAMIDGDGKPIIIPNELGESVTPSVIGFKEGEILYGEAAKELQSLGLSGSGLF